jgi:hypothetical protein
MPEKKYLVKLDPKQRGQLEAMLKGGTAKARH